MSDQLNRSFAAMLSSYLFTLALMAVVTFAATFGVKAEEADHVRSIVIVAQNGGTEVTDFLVPYGVFKRAAVGEVRAVSTVEGPVFLWPGLEIEADETMAQYDVRRPEGADLVIVPAVLNHEDEHLIHWIKEQAGKGAKIVSICDGALILARTGLLDGHSATGHWYTDAERRETFGAVEWQSNIRYVSDGNVASSAGVSASLPISLWLVEEMAGRERAATIAAELSVAGYGAEHDSSVFGIGVSEVATAAKNFLFGWPRETYAIILSPGMDEVALGFAVDMTARTYRSSSIIIGDAPIRTRGGLIIRPVQSTVDGVVASFGFEDGADLVLADGEAAARQILHYFDERYGKASADFVAMQLEYPR